MKCDPLRIPTEKELKEMKEEADKQVKRMIEERKESENKNS